MISRISARSCGLINGGQLAVFVDDPAVDHGQFDRTASLAEDQLAADVVKRGEGDRVQIDQHEIGGVARLDAADRAGQSHAARAADEQIVQNFARLSASASIPDR